MVGELDTYGAWTHSITIDGAHGTESSPRICIRIRQIACEGLYAEVLGDGHAGARVDLDVVPGRGKRVLPQIPVELSDVGDISPYEGVEAGHVETVLRGQICVHARRAREPIARVGGWLQAGRILLQPRIRKSRSEIDFQAFHDQQTGLEFRSVGSGFAGVRDICKGARSSRSLRADR